MLTDKEKTIAVRMQDHGIAISAIANILDKKYDQIRMAIRRQREKARLGDKLIISKSRFNNLVRREIRSIMDANPLTPYRDLPALLSNRLPSNTLIPSASSCYLILKELKFNNCKAIKKQFISTKNQQKRLEFALEYLKKEDLFWDLVVWSDETMVRKAPQGKELRFWVRNTCADDSVIVNEQIQGGGFGAMFWGCFSKYGLGPLVLVDGTMDRHKYVEILREYLLPLMKGAEDNFGAKMVFMQDNAPCHKAKAVLQFLEANEVETLPWPPQSPDLNPIENLWSIIKAKRQKKYGLPRSKEELVQQIFDIWDNLEDELVEVLADSASKRLMLCVEAKGKHTKY